MAGSRTLKLSILADVDDLKKKLDTGSKEVEGFGGKLEKFGKIAAAAFAAAAAAAAAYAGKLAIEGVKAAIEDEKANARLAATLRNVTSATENQIEKVLEYTRATELATGVTEDELRPSLNRLAIATGSVEKAIELQTLALDVSAGSGKGLEAVTQALAKAYEGNTASLGRLGVGLNSTELRAMSFEDITKSLARTFEGQADAAANSFEGRIARLRLSFEDVRDTVGEGLLPVVDRLLTFIVNVAIPKFAKLKDDIITPLTAAFNRNRESLTTLGTIIKDFVIPVIFNNFADALKFIGKVAGGILDVIGAVVNGIKSAVNFAIDAINVLIRAYNAVPLLPNVPTISKPSFSAPSTPSSSTLPKIATAPSPSVPAAPKPSTTPSAPAASTPTAPLTLVPSGNAIPSGFDVAAARRGEERGNVIVNVNAPSAIDEEGFTRAVILALNNTERRTGGGGSSLVTQSPI